MFRSLHFGLAGMAAAFSLPLIAVSFLAACLGVAVAAFLPRFVARRGTGGLDFQRKWSEDEFRFEDSARSYEELIDAHAQRRR